MKRYSDHRDQHSVPTRRSSDLCGMTLLAGRAVGAPFVGAAAATLALAEVLRLLHGGPVHQLIDLDLLSPDQQDRKSTRLNSSHANISYAVFCLKKKTQKKTHNH